MTLLRKAMLRCVTMSTVLTLYACPIGHAQDHRLPMARDRRGFLVNTDTFAIAYLFSSLSFDACGDTARGDLIRRTIVQRVMACPFSPEAKTAFTHNAGQALAKLKEGNARNPDRNAKNCVRIRADPKWPAYVAEIDAYGRDQTKLPQTLEFACDTPPVYP